MIDRIDWGCVVCNPDKERLARQPEVPVNPGPEADGLGCLQHREINCKRCSVLEFRHRTQIEWHPDRDRGARGLGVALLFLILTSLVIMCGWYVVHSWPK